MTIYYILSVLMLLAALFLVISVLMQNGKSHGLSGTITGGAETFFGKNKGKSIDKTLSKITTIVAIIFMILVIATFVIQPATSQSTGSDHDHDHEHEEEEGEESEGEGSEGEGSEGEGSEGSGSGSGENTGSGEGSGEGSGSETGSEQN